jgi:hypothetical protein
MHYTIVKHTVDKYLSLSAEEKVKFELSALSDWERWSRFTWVRFSFHYCDNALNRKLGRVGQSSGIRYGCRNLDLIPTKDKPTRRNRNMRTYRFYDTGRPTKANQGKNTAIRDAQGRYTKNVGQAIKGSWRSFHKNLFVVLTGVWHKDLAKFVKPDEYKAEPFAVS